MNNKSHIPVLLEKAIEELSIPKGARYVDATLGFGGHSEAILEKGGELLAIEADSEMLSFAEERLSKYCPTLVRGNFKDIEKIAIAHGFSPVQGVLFDLGIFHLV